MRERGLLWGTGDWTANFGFQRQIPQELLRRTYFTCWVAYFFLFVELLHLNWIIIYYCCAATAAASVIIFRNRERCAVHNQFDR